MDTSKACIMVGTQLYCLNGLVDLGLLWCRHGRAMRPLSPPTALHTRRTVGTRGRRMR